MQETQGRFPATQLALQFTTFIGREHELNAAAALVERADVRLLTLTGPGGTGKTRLSVQLLHRVQPAFPDGAYFVSLASISDASLLLTSIAETLGLAEHSDRPLLDQVAGLFDEKRAVLLLDNFEHILAAAPVVGQLLERAPLLKVIVTSRAPLHIYGEREFLVPALALPELSRLTSLEELATVEAVRLFVERAEAVRPDFVLSSANAQTVAEICIRLDGLPLAIELAAARCKVLTPVALLARLTSRFTLLTGGAHNLHSRQQTLRNTIDWSFQLLDPAEQILFARLAVFSGGWSLEAAEAVCGADLPFEILDGITALIDKSLVQQVTLANEEPRFWMLETIREYALEQLSISGQNEALRQQHARYYLSFAQQAEKEFNTPTETVWLKRLEEDFVISVAHFSGHSIMD